MKKGSDPHKNGTHWFIFMIFFRAAEPGLPDYVIPVRTGTGGQAGFPFYPPCTGCIFVGGAGSSSVSLRPPTKISAVASPGGHSNPCRFVPGPS
ncbi:MAG: hypothetical protein B6D64_06605 [Bacteroidetes bacterium 4484_276]|nr:MAG: hypothetical protein B6D64_06605 [Bacteroidetes bacterium 4484_276]